MSEASKRAEPKSKKSSSWIWITLSMLLTAAILVWAFSLPFRSGGSLLSKSDPGTLSATNIAEDDAAVEYASADEFRAAARRLDKEFMQARRLRTQLKEVPGSADVKQRWNQRRQMVRRQLKELGDAEEGTLQWQEKRELLQTLDDAPL